ncbi:MAG: deoxyguanosinetriphosphate triphosphohydrolase [Actinomycetales bacterium]|nr:deoxyguanosinetriphosphate triphosphohydrolase [Actinomycetales bacterium]
MTYSYDEHAQARLVFEPAKRPGRTAFERDRARILHSSALRRLSAKTQVLRAGADDFVRNRLTHSLEVAQVARELGKALGCDPDIVDSAALSHDLGHPPFGHNGEVALNEAAASFGGFEGNAQTLRLLTRLEAKTFDAAGQPAGLNLTRATLDACIKYPWARGEGPGSPNKFGYYQDDGPVFRWIREGIDGQSQPIEGQVMDLSDDIAYSVHDVEDGVVGGWFSLVEDLALPAVFAAARDWYAPELSDDRLSQAYDRLQSLREWPTSSHDGSRQSSAVLKSLTSALIGRFAMAAQQATLDANGPGPLVRHEANLVVPSETWDEITLLKAIAAHHVIRRDDRTKVLADQRDLVRHLTAHLMLSGAKHLDADLAADFHGATTDTERSRVIIDQVASLTDLSARTWADRLLG